MYMLGSYVLAARLLHSADIEELATALAARPRRAACAGESPSDLQTIPGERLSDPFGRQSDEQSARASSMPKATAVPA